MNITQRAFQITTSLEAAYGRLLDIINIGSSAAYGFIVHDVKPVFDRDRGCASVAVKVARVERQVGAWRVSICPLRVEWSYSHASVNVRYTPTGEFVFGRGLRDTAIARAQWVVKRRWAQAFDGIPSGLFTSMIWLDLRAIAGDKITVGALMHGEGLRFLLTRIEEECFRLWGDVQEASELPRYPIVANDPRLEEFTEEQRFWIASLNSGLTPAQFAASRQRGYVNKFISVLRKRRPDIVKPANEARSRAGRRGAERGKQR